MQKNYKSRLLHEIWERDLASLHWIYRWLVWAVRIVIVLVRDIVDGQLTLRAMSLVYTTLLSLVPLLAFSFSLLKAFGVQNRMEPLLFNFLEPLGPKGEEIGTNIMHFVNNVKAGVLGSVGLVLLLYTVISLVQKIESSFNAIWRVRQSRSLAERFSDYLSIILVGPILVVTALGITASGTSQTVIHYLSGIQPLGHFIVLLTRFMPYILVIAAFTFIYIFIPNTHVKLRSALVGGIAAGVMWETTGWAFARFAASSTQYTAIYSSFAILFIFMFWLYLSWLILLAGTSVAFYHQNPYFVRRTRMGYRLSGHLNERLALLIMYLAGLRYYRDEPPPSAEDLVSLVQAPADIMQEIIIALEQQGLLLRTAGKHGGYVPGKDMGKISIVDILRTVRWQHDNTGIAKAALKSAPAVDNLLTELNQSFYGAASKHTLHDLVIQHQVSGQSLPTD